MKRKRLRERHPSGALGVGLVVKKVCRIPMYLVGLVVSCAKWCVSV